MALKLLGREVEFVRFPGEGHELTRSGSPVHRLQRLEILLEWFGKHLSPSSSRPERPGAAGPLTSRNPVERQLARSSSSSQRCSASGHVALQPQPVVEGLQVEVRPCARTASASSRRIWVLPIW